MPRLFVYHSENKENEGFTKVVKIQEYKLLFYITIPAMWASIITGATMMYINTYLIAQYWMLIKLFFVILLFIFTYSMKYYFLQLQNNTCQKSGKFFRMYNEIPTIIMIAIVIFVVIKPNF